MKYLRRYWALTLVILVAVIIVSCEATPEERPPSQPPVEELPLNQPPMEMPTPNQAPAEEPPLNHPPMELPATEDPYTDLSDLVMKDPAEVDNSNLPITPVYKLGVTGNAPHVDITEYRLIVEGLVETPLSLTYESLLGYTTVTEVVLLICPFVFADNAEWTGVPVTAILAEANIKPEASEVTFYAIDGYRQVMSLKDIQQREVFLAHTVNGQILPEEHGFPVRLVVNGWYGAHWVKWVERIEIT